MTGLKSIKSTIWITFFLLSINYSFTCFSQVNNSVHISSKDGLLSNIVYDILQDKHGFVWMATTNGLSRYDGYSFVNFAPGRDNALYMNDIFITSMEEDTVSDVIWMFGTKRIPSCLSLKTNTFINYFDKNEAPKSYETHFSGKNNLWLIDGANGYRCIKRDVNQKFKSFVFETDNDMLADGWVVVKDGVCEDKKGNTWVCKSGGVSVCNDKGNMRIVFTSKSVLKGIKAWNNSVFVVDENAIITELDLNGKVKGIYKKKKNIVKNAFFREMCVWNDKIIIFNDKNVDLIDLKTHSYRSMDELGITNGRIIKEKNGVLYVSNNEGHLWRFTKDKILDWQLIPKSITEYTRRELFSVIERKNGTECISTYGNGFFIFYPSTGDIKHYGSRSTSPFIRSDYLRCVAEDRSGCLWISEDYIGVSKINQNNIRYISHSLENDTIVTDKNSIRTFLLTSDSTLLISNMAGDLYSYDLPAHKYSHFKSYGYKVYCTKLIDGVLWVGTRGEGLWIGDTRYTSELGLPSNHIYDIERDKSGRVWIATFGGGFAEVTQGQDGKYVFSARNKDDNGSPIENVHDLQCDDANRMWIASENGLYVMVKGKVVKANDKASIICLHLSSGGHIWAGTAGSGVFEYTYKNGKFTYKNIRRENGLSSNNISSITEDRFGNIIAATEEGVSVINKETHTAESYKTSHSVMSNVYNENSCIQLPGGNLLLGSHEGFIEMEPIRRVNNEYTRAVVTGISINGENVSRNKVNTLSGADNSISLKHNDNNITISFSNFDYNNIESVLYSYYLEGYDDTWGDPTTNNMAEYRDLDPGTYVFHLRTGKLDNSDYETLYYIKIKQPWWNTITAWIIYILVTLFIAWVIFSALKRNFDLHNALKMEKELTEYRLNFFSHISLEFKTPLTLIRTAADNLAQGKDQATNKTSLQTIRRGTNRLLKLIDDLVQFRKINTGNISMKIEQEDIVLFVKRIYDEFWPLSKQKEQSLAFIPQEKSFTMNFDKSKIDTIVCNLVRNAIQNTPEKGMIIIRLNIRESGVSIIIEDNGNDLSKDKQKDLFNPFDMKGMSGTASAIRLHIAQQYAIALNGSLEYRRREGGGSVFELILPDNNIVTEEKTDKQDDLTERIISTNIDESEELYYKNNYNLPLNKQTILLVEQDKDMQKYMSFYINQYFQTETCSSYDSAVEKIKSLSVSLVITEVSLPDRDGFELTKYIKSEDATKGIPVIQLSAYDDDDYRIRSLRSGCDSYICKPYNSKVLIATIFNLLSKQPNAAPDAAYSKNNAEGEAGKVQSVGGHLITSNMEKVFLEKMNSIVNRHISDANFNAERFADEMKYSRSQLYNKVKEICNCTPADFIRNQRLEYAARLIDEGELTISEIVYKVGMKYPAYFYKLFKEKYGVSPSQYAKGERK